MSKIKPGIVAGAAAIVVLALLVVVGSVRGDGRSDIEADAITSLAAYRSWTRVNPQPVTMDSMVVQLCAPAAPIRRPRVTDSTPHTGYYLTVYVNDTARYAMLQAPTPRFPVGSVIVKEKLKGKDAPAPELMTAMLKRESGYDPDNGDWEYLVMDGATRGVTQHGRLTACQGCHSTMQSNDFIYRTYLPQKAANPGN